jgi:hypothetical protein
MDNQEISVEVIINEPNDNQTTESVGLDDSMKTNPVISNEPDILADNQENVNIIYISSPNQPTKLAKQLEKSKDDITQAYQKVRDWIKNIVTDQTETNKPENQSDPSETNQPSLSETEGTDFSKHINMARDKINKAFVGAKERIVYLFEPKKIEHQYL